MAKSSVALQLAERLAKILVKLNNEEFLDLKTLADEYGVSERTLIRDFNERLRPILGDRLKQDSQQRYHLEVKAVGVFKQKDIKEFAQLGLTHYHL